MKKYLPILFFLAASAFAQLTVISPTSGATLQSPVRFQASMPGAKQMAVILDGATIFQQKTSTINFQTGIANGSHLYQIRAQAQRGGWVTKSGSFAIIAPPQPLVIVTTSLPDATCTWNGTVWDNPYYISQVVWTGGTPPYLLTIDGLPPGLTYAQNGMISGNIDCAAIFGIPGTPLNFTRLLKLDPSKIKLTPIVSKR